MAGILSINRNRLVSTAYRRIGPVRSMSDLSIQFIAGHRCLRIPAMQEVLSVEGRRTPPLILLGGTAQTIQSWVGHYNFFARKRDVIVVELRGQGVNPLLPPKDVAIESQVEDLFSFFSSISKVDPEFQTRPMDIVGFSFGGRVGMAFAACFPDLVNKLVLTSVGGDRGPLGRLIFQQWKSLLACEEDESELNKQSSLEPFAWASILSTYHPNFLAANEKRVPKWVDLLVQNNTIEGISGIVNQSYYHDSMSVAKLCSEVGVKGKIIYGSDDFLITRQGVVQLAQTANFQHTLFEDCAHAVPFESPIKWRKEVMGFLDSP